jgi:hypothetical protein
MAGWPNRTQLTGLLLVLAVLVTLALARACTYSPPV